jgi:hypothetical protein
MSRPIMAAIGREGLFMVAIYITVTIVMIVNFEKFICELLNANH